MMQMSVAGSRRMTAFPRLEQGWQRLLERLPRFGERHAILGALGPGKARFDRSQIQHQQLGILRLGSVLVMKKPLFTAVSVDQGDLFVRASGKP